MNHKITAPDECPVVSIVVPIYNVQSYLRQCVDSILAQTLDNIEVILVDDGSPDQCPAMVDEYAACDVRVVAIHQANGGYGQAVNHGVSLARGRYIGIIESDDWIEPTMFEKLYLAAERGEADVAKCAFYSYDSTKPSSMQNRLWTGPFQNLMDAPDEVFLPVDWPAIFCFHASLWSNLYRADFLKGIPMIESRSASYQDFPFMMEILAKAGRMVVVKECLVHYRMEEGQGSSTMRRDGRLVQMAVMARLGRDILQKYGILGQVQEEFYYHCFQANIGFYGNIMMKYKAQYLNELARLFEPLKENSSFQYKYFTRTQRQFLARIFSGKRTRLLLYHAFRAWRKSLIRFKIRKEFIYISLFGWKYTYIRMNERKSTSI